VRVVCVHVKAKEGGGEGEGGGGRGGGTACVRKSIIHSPVFSFIHSRLVRKRIRDTSVVQLREDGRVSISPSHIRSPFSYTLSSCEGGHTGHSRCAPERKWQNVKLCIYTLPCSLLYTLVV